MLHGVGPPLVISVGFGFAAITIMPIVGSDVSRILLGGAFMLSALVTGSLMLPEGRMMVKWAASRMIQR